jgi:predicted transcriptional regulator
MEGTRFDHISRSLATGTSRRASLARGRALGAVLTAALVGPAADDDEPAEIQAQIDAAKKRAEDEYDADARRGEPRLTQAQSRVLAILLENATGAHAYGLAQELGIAEETVRGALASLKAKGLVENGTIAMSSLGPARNIYQVVDQERAGHAIVAERQRRERKIEQLSQRLAVLTKS